MRKDKRNNIVSFRLHDGQFNSLNNLVENDPVVGVNSCNQMARKIVCDHLAGRLVYKNKSDKMRDFDHSKAKTLGTLPKKLGSVLHQFMEEEKLASPPSPCPR